MPRVVIFGAGAAGKSWLIRSYMEGRSATENAATINDEFASVHAMSDASGEMVEMCVVDTSGAEPYRSLVELEMSRADVGVCVVDLMRDPSLHTVSVHFVPTFISNAGVDVPFLLVGNRASMMCAPVSHREYVAQVALTRLNVTKYVEVGTDDIFGVQRIWSIVAGMAPAEEVATPRFLLCAPLRVDAAPSHRSANDEVAGTPSHGSMSTDNGRTPRSTPDASPRKNGIPPGCMVS